MSEIAQGSVNIVLVVRIECHRLGGRVNFRIRVSYTYGTVPSRSGHKYSKMDISIWIVDAGCFLWGVLFFCGEGAGGLGKGGGLLIHVYRYRG